MEVINIFAPGHLDVMDSYGLIATELGRHLTRLGCYVNLLPMGKRQMESQDEELAAITAQPVRLSLGGICLGYPTAFAAYGELIQHGPKLAITMFESSKLPPDWIPILNRCDAVIVPSRFCDETFRRCGVQTPLYVVPLGIGDLYQPVRRDLRRPLTFLAFLDRGSRKGGLTALQAFVTAFGEDRAYRLILKSRKPKLRMNLLNVNVDVIQEDLPERELYRLYLATDCLINPNRGEGFGLIPRAYAASGGIALATDWGGTAEEIEQWGMPLPYTLVAATWEGVDNFVGLDLGLWAEPSIEGIAQRLREVAARRHELSAAAFVRADWVRDHYRWSEFAENVLSIWQRHCLDCGLGCPNVPAVQKEGLCLPSEIWPGSVMRWGSQARL